MEKAKKNLKIWSILYIILSICDLVSIIGTYLSGEMDVSDIPANMQTGILIFVIGICSIIALIKLYLGIQGLRQANGTNKGKSHITIAKVILFFLVIALIAPILKLVKTFNFMTFSDLCLSLFSVIITFDYIKQAKYLKENK